MVLRGQRTHCLVVFTIGLPPGSPIGQAADYKWQFVGGFIITDIIIGKAK